MVEIAVYGADGVLERKVPRARAHLAVRAGRIRLHQAPLPIR
jgi:hypothetical protein